MGRSRVQIVEARRLCSEALKKAGYSKQEADTITDHLVDAEIRGQPNAGLARALSIAEHLRDSGIDPRDKTEVVRDGPAFARLDGHNTVGYLVARQATEVAINKAKTFGVSVVGANGFWYSGNLAYFAEMATREDLVCVIASNTVALVAPHGGYEPRFGTNPFCIGVPTGQKDHPVIWDIGTSKIMHAQIKLAMRLGVKLPEGSAYDNEGNPTTDPMAALTGVMAAWGGRKGSGLAVMVQLLGLAAGSPALPPFMGDFGFLIMAFDPSVLRPIDEMKKEADDYCDLVRRTKTLEGEDSIKLPFDGSHERRNAALASGSFETEQEVLDQLKRFGETGA